MVSGTSKLAQEFRLEFKRQLVTLITAAFGFVAALFWQNAIRDMIVAFVPQASTWQYEIVAAVIVTLVAVAAIFLLSRYAKNS